MSNGMDEMNAQRDAYIKKIFQEDKIISQPLLDTFDHYIDDTNIKVHKYTYKQKNISLVLGFLLIISLGFNVYLSQKTNTTNPVDNLVSITNKNTSSDSTISTSIDNTSKSEDQIVTNQSSQKSEVIETDDENTTQNSNSVISNVATSKNPSKDYSEIDITKFKEFIENYSYGINRISYTEDNLESNTILVMLAKKYFDSTTIPKNATSKLAYAFTVDNANSYIEEICGKKFKGKIATYTNYMEYLDSSKTYKYGTDIQTILSENYTCKDLKFTTLENDTYTATAVVQRDTEESSIQYELTIKFKLNENYLYQPFKIVDLQAKNKNELTDSTIHLVSE